MYGVKEFKRAIMILEQRTIVVNCVFSKISVIYEPLIP
jgi:hypothetical protein